MAPRDAALLGGRRSPRPGWRAAERPFASLVSRPLCDVLFLVDRARGGVRMAAARRPRAAGRGAVAAAGLGALGPGLGLPSIRRDARLANADPRRCGGGRPQLLHQCRQRRPLAPRSALDPPPQAAVRAASLLRRRAAKA